MCKVSICIPAYNDVEALQRLLDSIEIQTYQDYEVIITDDSTTTDVEQFVKTRNNHKICYYKNEKQIGATANCNAAMERASGEYIKMMHHDDWFADNNSIEQFVKMLDDNPDADIAFSGSNQVCKDSVTSRAIENNRAKELRKSYRALYAGNWIGAPSATIIRNKHQLFDENVKWLVDIELYMRILKDNPRFEYTKKPLVSIGVGEAQLTNSCESNWHLQLYEYKYVLNKLRLYRYPDCLFVYLKTCALCIWKIVMRKER